MTFTTRPTLRGTFGMASSTHWLASQSAMSVLERGGNAFDAAAAAAFVLHLVEPHLNGPGGEVPAIIATERDPRPKVLCGQGTAPAGATIAHFRDLGLALVPGSGLLAATVPGAVDAWMLLLRDHGTWRLRDVLQPAIGYARAGHPLAPDVVDAVASVEDVFREHWPTSAPLWLRGGRAPRPHALFTNTTYAETLERLIREGDANGPDRELQIEGARRAWRQGFVAEAIEAFAAKPHRDSSGQDHAGVITGADLAGWSASWEGPTTLDWNGVTVAKTGPWGQGPVLLQALANLEALGDLADLDLSEQLGIHFVTEAFKLAAADREAWYGDTPDVPLTALLSPGYSATRARLIGALASDELRPGSPDGATPRFAKAVTDPAGVSALFGALGEPTTGGSATEIPEERGAPRGRRGDTCHVDVVDRWGNIIAATPSGGWLQSSPAIPELGFCLGTRAQMFWLEEGLPSSLLPRRRPRTTLTPTLVLRDGQPILACGTPGGDQQDQWQLPFLIRHLVHGRSLQEAIDAPTWHTAAFPSSFWPREMTPRSLILEDRFPESVVNGLIGRGHAVTKAGAWSLGRLCAVARDPETGVVSAGANPRGGKGYACGR